VRTERDNSDAEMHFCREIIVSAPIPRRTTSDSMPQIWHLNTLR
jgi:hypothetical protein